MDNKVYAEKKDKHAISILLNLHSDKNKVFRVCDISLFS